MSANQSLANEIVSVRNLREMGAIVWFEGKHILARCDVTIYRLRRQALYPLR